MTNKKVFNFTLAKVEDFAPHYEMLEPTPDQRTETVYLINQLSTALWIDSEHSIRLAADTISLWLLNNDLEDHPIVLDLDGYKFPIAKIISDSLSEVGSSLYLTNRTARRGSNIKIRMLKYV